MFGNCNHCCFCCGHPFTMLGVSLSLIKIKYSVCVCVKKKKKETFFQWIMGQGTAVSRRQKMHPKNYRQGWGDGQSSG